MVGMNIKKYLSTIAAIAAITVSAHAEQIDIGGYFSINVPNSWQVTESGHLIHEPGVVTLYSAESQSCAVLITVTNPPEIEKLSFETFQSMTEADFPDVAQLNQRIGWSFPIVKKIELDGIPVLLFRQKRDSYSLLCLNLWIADRHFRAVFVYPKEGISTINKMLDSVKCGKPFMPITAQNGVVGDF